MGYDEKSHEPQLFLRTLGAMTDLLNFPVGSMLLKSVEERIMSTLNDLESIWVTLRLGPAFCGITVWENAEGKGNLFWTVFDVRCYELLTVGSTSLAE